MKKKYPNVSIVILAAGLGTRMKSNKAKVLHKINGKEMILYVVESAHNVAGDNVVVVIGHQAEKVKQVVETGFCANFAIQEQQLGTGHAVMTALPQISESSKLVVILCGDVPLVRQDTIRKLIENHVENQRDATILAARVLNPRGYGRILYDENQEVKRIVEESDASEEQKKINIINTGIYCLEKKFLTNAVSKISPNNAQEEFYFTDIIEIGRSEKRKIGAVVAEDPKEFIGVNNLDELQNVEAIVLQKIHKS